MEQRLNFVTIGVKDLGEMKTWYIEKFGWTPLKDTGGIVFFKLNGLLLGLFPADELADDIGVPQDGKGFKRFTLAINFNSQEEVDNIFETLRKKEVKIVKEPAKVFWGGYSGYIADPENNYWELAHNPFLEMDQEGNVVTHQ